LLPDDGWVSIKPHIPQLGDAFVDKHTHLVGQQFRSRDCAARIDNLAITAVRAATAASGSAAEARVLLAPLRARAAHVVQFGLVSAERQSEATQQFEGTEKKHDPADKNEG
jgi:imidazolonepropionase-like amidohydrolase